MAWASAGPIPLVSGTSHCVEWGVARIKLECGHLKGGPRVRALYACFLMELAIWKGSAAREEMRTIQYVGIVPVCVSLPGYPCLCMCGYLYVSMCVFLCLFIFVCLVA